MKETKLPPSRLTKHPPRERAAHAREGGSREEPPAGVPRQGFELLVIPEQA